MSTEESNKKMDPHEDQEQNWQDRIEKAFEEKIEDSIEKKVEGFITPVIETIVTVIVGVVMYLVLNRYLDRIPFVTEDFTPLLPSFNLVIIINIILALSRIVIRFPGYKQLVEIINNVFFFYLSYQVWRAFPFDTSVIGDPSTWDNIFKGIMILTIFAAGMGTVTAVSKLINAQYCPDN